MIRRLVPVPVLVLALAAVALPAVADDLEDELADVEADVAAVSDQISSAREQRSALASDVQATQGVLDAVLVDLGQTRIRLDVMRDELAAQQSVLDEVRIQLGRLYIELDATRRDIAAGRADAQHWAREQYMRAGQDPTTLALDADDLVSVGVGMAYLERIAEVNDRALVTYEALRQTEERQAALIEEREGQLEAEVTRLEGIEHELADLEAELAAQQAEVEAELQRRRSQLSSVEDDIAHFEGELVALEAEQNRLEEAIRSELAKGRSDGPVPDGAFVRPVPGVITSVFGPRTHPILGYTRMHTGLDFRAAYGQPIVAAASGTVILAGPFGGYGNTVVVSHGGGLTTLYAHQSSLNVGYGADVGAGDVVGFVGSTGLSTGPHLHFEVRVNGGAVDPMAYL
jgi:murein DD-endopeptidase MepM/ murein hydrolase activator NlpD